MIEMDCHFGNFVFDRSLAGASSGGARDGPPGPTNYSLLPRRGGGGGGGGPIASTSANFTSARTLVYERARLNGRC